MPHLFVFTAGNPEARQHLADTIENPIDDKSVFDCFDESHHEELERIKDEGQGFYAWGAVWGIRNVPTWEQMERDDFVLCVYASMTAPTATSPGFSPSTITPSAPKPSGAPTRRGRRGATCTS